MNIIRCQEQIASCEKRKEKLLTECNLGARFKARTFGNFDKSKNEKAYDTAMKFADSFKENNGEGLIFMGTTGTGKTHLAAGITNYLIARGVAVKFGNIVDIFDSARTAYSTDEDILSQIKKYPLLVIDDLGKERKTEWTDEKIYSIVNYRYEHQLPIIFTTNLTADELTARVGEATMSRIKEMCSPVKMVGKDMRV